MPREVAFNSAQSFVAERDDWPKPTEEAFYGLAGDIVRIVEPHSEADPMALLVQMLIAFGSAAGNQPHFLAEADRHAMNLFAAFVGETAKARKGTSWGRVKQVLTAAEPDWDPDADEVLMAIRRAPEGLTRTNIRDLFSRHRRSDAVARVLTRLVDQDLLRCVTDVTGGRPAERYQAVRS